MADIETGPGTPSRRFSAGLTNPSATGEPDTSLRRRWDVQVGKTVPLPPAELASTGDFRVNIHGTKLHDAFIANISYNSTKIDGTWVDSRYFPDMIAIDVVRRGTWHFTRPRGRDRFAVPAGQFIARYNNSSWQFAVASHTTQKLMLPVAHLGPLIRRRPVLGSSGSAEMRLLLAHVRMIEATLDDLSPAGVHAARNALLELTMGVLTQKTDGDEPLFTPALAQAAQDLANIHLADPELSPVMLARELNVSVRTLQRAFAATNESVTAYIRRQRLEQARHALITPHGRPSISELAARLQFADSSHFIRTFKEFYGQTPAQYARSHGRTATP
ncbi:helix-turn-helix transcriptional regulator [Streptomyces phaeochromogenes]|uniref:helix-turn-helix transcriptional regulator n=1 Tax=Streptomyces phaeochromogenes TaxID=1923 RepID=UPI0032511774